jgi:topoisomerase IA-like protein
MVFFPGWLRGQAAVVCSRGSVTDREPLDGGMTVAKKKKAAKKAAAKKVAKKKAPAKKKVAKKKAAKMMACGTKPC